MERMPSPAHSILKAALTEDGHEVQLEYWNLKLNASLRNFLNMGNAIYESEFNKFLPFYAYLGIDSAQQTLIDRIINYILYLKPQLHAKGRDYILSEFYKFHSIFDELIRQYIEEIVIPNDFTLIGFSSSFYQWVIATIIAPRIKKALPNLPIIIGGFGTRKEATAFLHNFNSFDFASWGEGEQSLSLLCEYLSGNTSFSEVPNTLKHTTLIGNIPIKTTQYVNLDNIRFNFSDYFNQVKGLDIPDIVLPIEGGRGCHWRRCKFCFLNSGYRYRLKSSGTIINEIKYYIQEYNIKTFLFLDNDIIGGDINRFINILDGLIEIRSNYGDFSILSAEIITKGLTYEAIVKMSLVNFESVQIGYESPSANLLKKINKKNTFASNLFFIKWATQLGIRLSGANIIRNLPEETDADIMEGINNLKFLRFFLEENVFYHSHSDLAIAESSKYFTSLVNNKKIKDWNRSAIFDFLPDGYVKEDDKYALILDFMKSGHNSKWDIFSKIERHYIDNNYTYNLIKGDSSIVFRELYNGLITNELEFILTEPHWSILCFCNKQVHSLSEISIKIGKEQEIVIDLINSLKEEGLIYTDTSYTEVVTIINTDIVK